jgi:phenylalanyl-tRNA synthetase beta chain
VNAAFLKMENEKDEVFSLAMVLKDHSEKPVCRMGIVNPLQTSKMGISVPVYFAELNWTELMRDSKKNHVTFHDISKFPAVSRDLALLLDNKISFLQIEEVAYGAERKLLKKVELFDVYEGENVPVGKKSYAVNFVLQDEGKTLNDKQIEKAMQNIIHNLQTKLDASLR